MDFHARQYDPQLGRFLGVDPLAASGGQDMFSPYAAMGNAPESMIDPNGLSPIGGYRDIANPRLSGNRPMDIALDMTRAVDEGGYGGAGGSGGGSGGNWDLTLGAGGGVISYFGAQAQAMWANHIGQTATQGEGSTASNFGNLGGNSGGNGILPGGYREITTVNSDGASSSRYEYVGNTDDYFTSLQDEESETPWYVWGGQANWGASAVGSLFEVGGDLNSMAMYSRGIRGGVYGNYRLTGRNLSLFKNARMSSASRPISSIGRWGGRLGFATAGVGLILDVAGVINYANNPNSVNAVHPGKAGLNTSMSAYGLWVNPLVGALYFGIDAFYPGGWIGASQTAERTEINERRMTGHSFFSNSALKQ